MSSHTYQASNRLAREVDATQTRKMGQTNRDIFACFARYGSWDGNNWSWGNTSTTQRAMESFEKRGLAIRTTQLRRNRETTVWVTPQPLRDRLGVLAAEVEAERKARDAAREEDARYAAQMAEARTHTVKTFREALAAAGITGPAADLVINRLPK